MALSRAAQRKKLTGQVASLLVNRQKGPGENKRVLLPGKKYSRSGAVVQDPNAQRIQKRNQRQALTGGVSQGKQNKLRGKKKFVMHYLSGGG